MGSDKGLLKLEAKTWSQTAMEKMALLGIGVKLSVNRRQYNDYGAVFSAEDLITDDDTISFTGPVAGVLSAHRHLPEEDIFLLACDMPLMETAILRQLLDIYHQHPGHDAWLYSNNGELEPLCAIFSARALERIIGMYLQGKLEKHSMKYMLEHINSFVVPLREDEKKYFRNFNAHAELNGL